MQRKNEETNLINELRELLNQKKSKEYYARRLNISVGRVNDLLDEIRGVKEEDDVDPLSNSSKRLNLDKGELEVNTFYDHEPSPEEVMIDHKIDETKWKLSAYWSKAKGKGWQVSALFRKLEGQANLQEQFIDFLKDYKPQAKALPNSKYTKQDYLGACLIINPTDAHYNKFDRRGNNNIEERFANSIEKIKTILDRASACNNLEKVIYCTSGDMFNSEHDNNTTHGTPQQNILTHNEGFEAICNNEVNVINLISQYTSDVEVIHIPSNHDFYMSWYMVKWLEAYFRESKNITVDSTDKYSKYRKYSNTAICLNHGYKVKPEKLAANFPIEFKEHWSECDNYVILVGDLHCDLSKEINGIQFYRLAQASNSISKWDEENGYTLSKGVISGFLIETDKGITNIIKA